MIDLEHCTILGNETVDANSLNRCMFNLFRKMDEASDFSVGAKSDNIPSSPFFSGGYDNALTDIPYVASTGVVSANSTREGVVPRLYCGNLNIYGSQDDSSFSTESETGTYYYTSEELSTFAPSVSSLYNEVSPLILRSVLMDDESTMVTGVSSLGTASSPIVKFTSYLTCSNAGVSFGTVTFKRNNGDRQKNTITLNIARDLIGIDGIESVDFFTIGNGFASGVKTVSENLDMISDIGQCTVTYNSDNDVIVSNITKNDNSDVIKVEKDTGRIVEDDDDSYGRYIELSNDEVVLNFFTMFTLKENAIKYSDDLWCFYIVNDFSYGKRMLNDARGWAKDYFKYSFDNFEAADDGINAPDGTHLVDFEGCVLDASDAFNGCYNASFKSLCWFSPRLRYTERMFKGCTHASFDSLPKEISFNSMRSAVSMFENCMSAPFGNITTIDLSSASRLSMMFAGCSNASFDVLSSVMVGGDATKMFYVDYSSDFLSLKTIGGAGTRLISMFEGCDNAEFPVLDTVSSNVTDVEIDATKMFYGLEKPEFGNISTIELGIANDAVGYIGVSMFESCINATFENLTNLGNLVDGTRMFFGCDPYFSKDDMSKNMNRSTFSAIHSLGGKLVVGREMFKDNYFLDMTLNGNVVSLKDGTSMFENTSSVVVNGNFTSLEIGDGMFSHTMTAHVFGDMDSLKTAEGMFMNVSSAEVRGSMKSLIDARTMFLSSDEVDIDRFPSTVEDATLSFANISKWCNISDWESAVNNRFCDEGFYNSKNVSITGDVVAGNVISTSHMFDSAKNVRLCNVEMSGVTDSANQFYSTEAGENFVYVQKYDENGRNDSGFVFIGNADADTVGKFVSDSISGDVQDSLFIAAKLKTRRVEYSIYSVEPSGSGSYSGTYPRVSLECDELKFDSESIIVSADYSYASVSGYSTATLSRVDELAIRRTDGVAATDVLTTGYYLFNDSTINSDHRFVSISSYDGRYEFKEYVSTSDSNPSMTGAFYYEGGGYNIRLDTNNTEYFASPSVDFTFDFIQLSSANNVIKPQFVVSTKTYDGAVNRYALVPKGDSGSTVSKVVKLGKSQYSDLMIENSADDIHVDVIEARKYGVTTGLPYGYLMQYKNEPYNDNRLVFSKYTNGSNVLSNMLMSPKRYRGDFTVAQVFTEHSYSDDVPFAQTGSEASSATTRVQTRFSIGNADMAGTWKYADSMFYDVVEDSLLSGYYCLTDTSLVDVGYMYALEEKVDDDKTFRYAGPLLQNLRNSDVVDMEGMFLNRYVCEPNIFKDLYHEGESYISFNIPTNVTNALSAFKNCEIEDFSETASQTFDEIGLNIPPTLTGATDMFRDYKGPKIRFGYDSDGSVYIADGIECDGMFYGCDFTNTPSDKFGFSVPSIYLSMFDGSNFEMNNISSLVVRNGMNFSNPYSGETFFYNGTKLLGCSSISFDSLKTDVIDWFCTDTSDVEGVYLATVIGPKNDIALDSDGNYLSGDYRLMSADKFDGYWKTYMSKKSQFVNEDIGNAMVERLYESTNSLKLNLMTEIENRRARMTCMFNLPILFSKSNEFLGDAISSCTPHRLYKTTYSELSGDEFKSKTYNSMDFGLVEHINGIEMPFAFCGLSGATFDSLRSVSPSAVMSYGAFMNCSSASFDSLTSVDFMQNGENQPDTMASRFSPTGNYEWYGNYCNMFAGCENASMGSLQTLMLNSQYSTYGKSDDRVLTWFDVNGDINYMTYSNFDSRFMFSFYAEASGGNIHVAISDKDFNKFFDYDTQCDCEYWSTIDVRFFVPEIASSEVLAKISINPIDEYSDYIEPFEFFIDTLGFVSTDPSSHFIGNYTVALTGDEGGADDTSRTYMVNVTGDYGIKEPKYLVLYRNATGYHSIDVDENYMRDINYRIAFSEASGYYSIDVYDNNSIDVKRLIKSFITSGVEVSDECTFKLEMTEVNYELTPIITIIDSHNDEHIYEILADGTVEALEQHPKRGVVKSLGYETATAYPFMSGGSFISDLVYSDPYGQTYTIDTSGSIDGYYLLLRNNENEVARLYTPIIYGDPESDSDTESIEPSSVFFNIGSYSSNGLDCVIVTISHENQHVFYKIYKDSYFDEYGNAYKYVEETEYDPEQPLEYKLLTEMEFGKNIPLSHRAYCSGMFMDDSSATFGQLNTISLPSIGSCAGMFAGCESINTSSLKYLVLPRTEHGDSDDGFIDYKGIFDGVPVSSVSLAGLTEAHTNIYALGKDGSRTIGYELFSGMVDDDSVKYDDSFNAMTKEDAISKLNLDKKIADRMIWNNGMFDFSIYINSVADDNSRTFRFVARTVSSNGNIQVDWGDGSDIETVSGLSNRSFTKFVSHEYQSTGNYRIRVSNNVSRVVMGYYGEHADMYNDVLFNENLGGISPETKITEIHGFGSNMTNLAYAFAGCLNLRSIPSWGESVTNVSYCYYGCSNINTMLVPWVDSITECAYCYYGCRQITQTFSDSIYELMPTHIMNFYNCVYGTGEIVRSKFFIDWGGTGDSVQTNLIHVHVQGSEDDLNG